MNLYDSKKKLAVAGILCGVVAAILAYFGNPANMAFCIACFVRDMAGALGMHQAKVTVFWNYRIPLVLRLELYCFSIISGAGALPKTLRPSKWRCASMNRTSIKR